MSIRAWRWLRRGARDMARRDLLFVAVPLLALLAGGFWLAAQFVKPAPPARLVLSSGGEGGAYQHYAARYREVLARYGIELVERPSRGSIENLARLRDAGAGVDAALVQGGTGRAGGEEALYALGGLYREPLWVFYRGAPGVRRLDQLVGRHLAVGPEGSGTRMLALELLQAHGLVPEKVQLSDLAGMEAVDALAAGRVDVVFSVGAAHSAAVWALFFTPGVALLSLDHAEAYVRRYPYLAHVTLPAGAIDLQRDIPPRDVELIASTATLVVHEALHPALVDLLLQAVSEVHGEPGLFARAGDFPNAAVSEFPLSPRAKRYYQSGPPFLQRYLPFWAANLIDRMIVLLLPVVALLIPLMRIAPQLYSWRVRSRIYRWYGALKLLEFEAETRPESRSREEWLAEIDRIERAVNHIRTPLAFTDYLYTLRLHIGLVRREIVRRFEQRSG